MKRSGPIKRTEFKRKPKAMTSPAEKLAAEKAAKCTRKMLFTARGYCRHPCRLREMRQSLGLTQRDVANAIGEKQLYLSNVEHGNNLRLDVANKLSEFFSCSVDDMWPAETEP